MHRLLTAALLVAAPLVGVLVAVPAQAHGAPDNPVSRAFACGPEGGSNNRGAACQAALAAGNSLAQWDYIRVANVAGRDRQLIPDGKLCSAGIAQFRGLDLARADWPATTLTPGAAYSFSYRETVPHKGTFRMYVTNDSYDPTRPLLWADLQATPFLTVTDPPLQGTAYVLKGRLPAGRTGRQLIYTIWQNTSTADTYYSCSDVIFAAATPAGSANQPGAASPTGPQPAAGPTGATSSSAGLAAGATRPVSQTSRLPLISAAAIVTLAAITVGLLLRRRRATARSIARHAPDRWLP